jgi:predicted nuclease with TOPRIM domain
MTKQSIIAYAVLVLLGIVLTQHFLYQNEKYATQIKAAEDREAVFDEKEKALKQRVVELESMQEELVQQVENGEGKITSLKQDIVNIKASHAREIAKTYRLDSDDATVTLFKKTIPEFASGTRTVMQDVMQEVDGVAIPVPIFYAQFPSAYLEHFIRLHQENESLTAQVGKHVEIDSLNEQIKDLKDKNFALEVEKRGEYERGYDRAAKEFKETNAQYVALMEQKRFGGVLSTVGSFVAGIALGVNF